MRPEVPHSHDGKETDEPRIMLSLSREEAQQRAAELMERFAERTGLTSARPPQRYLWTDAFAVCNYLGLARATGQAHYTQLALQLVDSVHHVLGRYRTDDVRAGWLGGLGEQEGESHPTRGGLRIGKPLRERGPGEPYDDALEWDRDGQYFHYLTRWMHALDQVSRATGERRFNQWSRELAQVAHAAFVAPDGRRMAWKMSTDLSRPLVPSMGQHDPLDGLITCVQLEATAARFSPTPDGPSLKEAIAGFSVMVEAQELWTADPLGLGGLLTDAWRLGQLTTRGAFKDLKLLERLLEASQEGLREFSAAEPGWQPASRRLAFRELGLAIGLSACALLQGHVREEGLGGLASPALRAHLARLEQYVPLGPALVSFWLAPEHQKVRTWTEHRDINEVMLATSLLPEGFF